MAAAGASGHRPSPVPRPSATARARPPLRPAWADRAALSATAADSIELPVARQAQAHSLQRIPRLGVRWKPRPRIDAISANSATAWANSLPGRATHSPEVPTAPRGRNARQQPPRRAHSSASVAVSFSSAGVGPPQVPARLGRRPAPTLPYASRHNAAHTAMVFRRGPHTHIYGDDGSAPLQVGPSPQAQIPAHRITRSASPGR